MCGFFSPCYCFIEQTNETVGATGCDSLSSTLSHIITRWRQPTFHRPIHVFYTVHGPVQTELWLFDEHKHTRQR